MRNVVVDVQAVHQDIQDRNLKAALEVPVLCLALPNSDGNVELEEVEREARAYATKRLLCMQPEALLCSKLLYPSSLAVGLFLPTCNTARCRAV